MYLSAKAVALLKDPVGHLPSLGCLHADVPGLFFGPKAVPVRLIINHYHSHPLPGKRKAFLGGIHGN
jgi:hypothetical protein